MLSIVIVTLVPYLGGEFLPADNVHTLALLQLLYLRINDQAWRGKEIKTERIHIAIQS